MRAAGPAPGSEEGNDAAFILVAAHHVAPHSGGGAAGGPCRGDASADNSTNYLLSQDALNETLSASTDLRAKNLPIKIDGGNRSPTKKAASEGGPFRYCWDHGVRLRPSPLPVSRQRQSARGRTWVSEGQFPHTPSGLERPALLPTLPCGEPYLLPRR